VGPIEAFIRFIIALILFVGVLIAGLIFTPQLLFLKNLPGTVSITSGGTTVYIPVLGAIVASVALTLIVNLVSLPFRRVGRNSHAGSG
jgi:hypothetical protein